MASGGGLVALGKAAYSPNEDYYTVNNADLRHNFYEMGAVSGGVGLALFLAGLTRRQ
jgi:hypothetical protein